MSEASPAATVCGFWDEANGAAGTGWSLAGASGGAVTSDGAVVAAAAEIAAAGGDTVLALSGDAGARTATLSPRPEPAVLAPPDSGAAGGGGAAAICAVAVEAAGSKPKRWAGQVTTWDADPTDGAALVRHLAIPAPDGGLVIVTAARGPGREDHAGERVAGWLLGADGTTAPFAEALLSTQYDADGRQTRVGLELWPRDSEAPAMRAAATALGAVRSGPVTAAILRSSAEGTTGPGTYLIWRR